MKKPLFSLLFLTVSIISCTRSNLSNYYLNDSGTYSFHQEIGLYDLSIDETTVEIGTGEGYFACLISRMYPDMKFILEDLATSKIKGYSNPDKYLPRRTSHCPNILSNYIFISGEENKFPITSNSQNQILVRDTFHEFSSKELMSLELVRILKPGGKIIISEIEPKYPGEINKGCKNMYVTAQEIAQAFPTLRLEEVFNQKIDRKTNRAILIFKKV